MYSGIKGGKIDACLKNRGNGPSYVEKMAFQCQGYLVFADATAYEASGQPTLDYYMIDSEDNSLVAIKAQDAQTVEVSQAWENKKLFITCNTAFGMNHTLKLTYGADKIDVSTFLVTRDVRGTVMNGLCQAYPPREEFYQCQDWASTSISFDNPIAFNESSFRTDNKGPSSCNANGWISKIGEYKGLGDFCPYSKDDGSDSSPSACSKDISSCTQLCKSYFQNNAEGLETCNNFAQDRCDSCNTVADLNLPSDSYYHE